MVKKLVYHTLLFLLLATLSLQALAAKDHTQRGPFKKNKIKTQDQKNISSEVGLNIPSYGIAIDAVYDPRLTDLIPGYHIVNIVVTNRRGEPVKLSTRDDKWSIVDDMGKKHTAHNHVKEFDRKLWPELPAKLQEMLEYPHHVSPGHSVTIDVFLPKSVALNHFREVIWKSAYFEMEFDLFTNYEKILSVPATNEFATPKQLSMTPEEILQSQKDAETIIAPQLEIKASTDLSPKDAPTEPASIGKITDVTPNTTVDKGQNTVDGFIRVK